METYIGHISSYVSLVRGLKEIILSLILFIFILKYINTLQNKARFMLIFMKISNKGSMLNNL
jgi:hypothetical protein